jgi:hypothetical protein
LKKFKTYFTNQLSPENKFRIGLVLLLMLGYGWLFFQKGTIHVHSESYLFLKCPSQTWLGIACPGCGMTRSIIAITNGDWQLSFSLNPFGYPAALLLLIVPLFLLLDLYEKKNRLFIYYQNIEKLLKINTVRIPLMILILVNWIWNLIKYP